MTELHLPHVWGKLDTIPLTRAPLSSQSFRLQEQRQSLMEKLFPSPRLQAPRDAAPVLVEEKGNCLTNIQQTMYKTAMTFYDNKVTQQHNNTTREGEVEAVNETLHSSSEASAASTSANTALGIPGTGERVFVFRVPPESHSSVDAPRRKRKRNFLNLKKGSVAPTNLPWDLQTFAFGYGFSMSAYWWYFTVI